MKRVALVAAFRDGMLLLGKRNDSGKWTVPGGSLNEGEDPVEGAKRELREETGLEPDSELVLVDERTLGDTKLYTYECEVDEDGVPSGADDPDSECSVWAFFDISDGIPKAVAENMAGPKDPEKNVTASLYGLAKSEVSDLMPQTKFVVGLRLAKEAERFENLEVDDSVPAPKPSTLPKKPTHPGYQDRDGLTWYDYSDRLPEEHKAAGGKMFGAHSWGGDGRKFSMHVLGPDSSVAALSLHARPVQGGSHQIEWGQSGEAQHEGLKAAMSDTLKHHMDLHRTGKLQEVQQNSPSVKRVHNPYADSKATESTAKYFKSNRRMADRKVFDYSHHLPEERRNQGYTLTVYHHPDLSVPAISEIRRNGKREDHMVWGNVDGYLNRLTSGVIETPKDDEHAGRWGQYGHSLMALTEHIKNRSKVVHDVTGHAVSSIPFLDTLPLPELAERGSLLEVESTKKKTKAKPPAAGDETASRAAQLEVQEPAQKQPETMPTHLPDFGSDREVWDYGHHLTPEQRAAGWALLGYHTPGTFDNFMRIHAYRNGLDDAGMVWAYPSSAQKGGTLSGPPENRTAPPDPAIREALINAMKQHGSLHERGELQHLMAASAPSRASLLELSEKDLAKEEDQPPQAVKKPRARKPKAPAAPPETNLVGTHNLTHANLEHAHNLGGLVAPSLAIAHKDHPVDGFGDISLVASHHLVDPAQNPVFDADIYSPRHPKAKYDVDRKGLEKFRKFIEPHAKATNTYYGDVEDDLNEKGTDGILENSKRRASLGHAYLSEKGGLPEMPVRAKRFPWANAPVMREFVAKHKECCHKGAPQYPDNEHYEEWSKVRDQAIEQYTAKHVADLAAADPSGNWGADDASEMVENFKRQADRTPHHRIHEDVTNPSDGSPDHYAFADAINAKTKGDPEFEAWAKEKTAGLLGKQYLPKYIDTSDGPRERRLPYTPDSVLKEMTRKVKGGEGFFYGLGSVRAMGANRFRDLAHMQSQRHKIVPKEQFEKAKEQNQADYHALEEKLRPYSQFSDYTRSLHEAIAESYARGKNAHWSLKNNGFTGVPSHLVQEVHDFARKLQDMPTEYFESKPQRVVGINEFQGAAIPHGSPQSTLDILKHHGINHVEMYDKDKPGDRAAAIARIHAAKNLFLGEMPMTKSEVDEVDRMLRHPSVAERKMALKLANVQSKHLVRAFADPEEEVRQLALHHPALDHDALMGLMQQDDAEDSQLKALHHPQIASDHLRALYHKVRMLPVPQRAPLVRAIATQPALETSLIHDMLADGNGLVAIDSLRADPEDLARVVADFLEQPDNPRLRVLARRALVHPNLDPAVARDAFKDGDYDTRYTIACGPNLPADLAKDVLVNGQFPAHDHEALLRIAIVQNPVTPLENKRICLKDRNASVTMALGNYMAKSGREWLSRRLAKAIHQPDFKSVVKASAHEGRELVDHAPDLTAHPPEHHIDSTVYRQHVLESPKVLRRTSAGKASEGITKKLMYAIPDDHPTHGGTSFMVKPYHEAMHPKLKAWSAHPHQGWAEMTNQALYHAAGIGNIHQRVHVAEHNMGPGLEKEPALVVHMEKGWDHLEPGAGMQPVPRTRADARKIAVMDFLSNNLDRHWGNLLYKQDGGMKNVRDENGQLSLKSFPSTTSSVLAIDHGRSFQYVNSHESKWAPRAKQPKRLADKFSDYVNRSAVSSVDRLVPRATPGSTDFDRQRQTMRNYGPIFEWWGDVSPKVRAEFDKRLGQIRDPKVRAHLKRNFETRANWLDERAEYGIENYGENWYDDPIDVYRPDEMTENEKTAEKFKGTR